MRLNASFIFGLIPVIESNCPNGSIEYWVTEPWDFGGKDSEGLSSYLVSIPGVFGSWIGFSF